MPHWLWSLWFGYVYPSLKGNGPEAICQTIVYGIIALIVVPPFRRFIKHEAEKLHSKLDHSIRIGEHIVKHHPDIPPLPPNNTPKL
jgi:hypothetical protein